MDNIADKDKFEDYAKVLSLKLADMVENEKISIEETLKIIGRFFHFIKEGEIQEIKSFLDSI